MAADHPVRGTTRLAGVIGWPVDHSRSPQMHNAAYRVMGLDWIYVPLAVRPPRLAEALRSLPSLGFSGVNITIPHKQAAAEACDELSPEADMYGSVNTVVVEGESLHGHTTDGSGMLDAVGELPAARAVVLGAGGAARAAVGALRHAGAEVWVCARHADSAARLAGERVLGWPLAEPAGLVVNATPVGQQGDPRELPVDPRALDGTTVVCDLVYRGDGAETRLIAAARAAGCRTVDGLAVLVGQGARSFRLFTGLEPPLDVMERAVRGD